MASHWEPPLNPDPDMRGRNRPDLWEMFSQIVVALAEGGLSDYDRKLSLRYLEEITAELARGRRRQP
jgi:hypothetical protein